MHRKIATEERLRSCCAELERKLRAGEPCRAEDFFAPYPELTSDPENAIELIYAEYVCLAELGKAPPYEEYYSRFPDWCEPLFHQFQFHTLLSRLAPGACTGQDESLEPLGNVSAGPWQHSPDNFEILHEIARGSMGIVYKAWQKNVQRVVALKVILARSLSTPDQLARFRIEAAAIGRLIHPNIVQIFNFREWKGWPYLVLEYVDGKSLAQHWNGQPQPPEQVATLVEILARTMDYAHERGVVHRDLRPGNILIGLDGAPKIIDFGLAKLKMWTYEDLTMTGQILGTPSYMAPEQVDGSKYHIGPLVDVYALGAVMYEGLTGQPPFRGQTIFDTLQEVGFKEVAPPRRLRSDIPRDLETICLKCLQKEQQRRYANAGEVAADLRRFLTRQPLHARRVQSWERAWYWCRRNQLVASLFLTLFLVLVAGLSLVTWKWRGEVIARNDAERARALAQKEEGHALHEKLKADRLVAGIILDQAINQGDHGNMDYALLLLAQSLEKAIQNKDSALEWAARVNLSAFRPQLFRRRARLPHPDWAWAVACSPDGKFIVTACKDRAARIWDTESGQPRGEPLWHDASVWAVAISPDGKTILTGSADPETGAGEVRLWDAATGQALGEPLLQGKAMASVAFSHDGLRILALDANLASSAVHLWETASRKAIDLKLPHPGRILTAAFSPDSKLILTAGTDGTARLWKMPDGTPVGPVLRHEAAADQPLDWRTRLVTAAFSPDGQRLATGSQIIDKDNRYVGGDARVWAVATGELLASLAHSGPLKTVLFSPNAQQVVTAGFAIKGEQKDVQVGMARLWDVASARQLGPTFEHTRPIWAVAFNPHGNILVTGGEDGYTKLWLTATGERIGTTYSSGNARSVAIGPEGKTAFIGHTYTPALVEILEIPPGHGAVLPPLHAKKLRALAFSADGKLIATAGDDGTARLYDAVTAKSQGVAAPHQGGARCLAFSPDGKLLLTAPEPKTAQVLVGSTGKPHAPPMTHDAQIVDTVFTPDGKHVVLADSAGRVGRWDVATGERAGAVLNVGKGRVTFCPEDKFFAVANDTDVQVWSTSTGKPCGPPLRHREGVSALAFSPTCTLLATGSEDGFVTLWDAATGTMHGRPVEHPLPVRGIVFSPDGKTLLTRSANNNVRLWSVDTGLPLGPPMFHPAEIAEALFTPDSRIVLVASGTSVWLWDVATGKRLGPPLRHPDVVTQITCQPQGKQFATAAADGLVRLWGIPTPTCGDIDHIKQWAEVLTGRRLCEQGTLREIDAATLLESRRRLEARGGEPFPLLGPIR